jgi:hypothetical protein
MKFIINLIGNSWIKDNIGMIILVPTVLGGLWQIIELARIGIPFIRFFSVSQLVSDGLLLLFIFTWTYLVWRMAAGSLDTKRRESNIIDEPVNNESLETVTSKKIFIKVPREKTIKKRDGYIWVCTMLILLFIIFKWAWWPEIVIPLVKLKKLTIMTILGIVTGITIFWLGFQSITHMLLDINNVKLNRNNEWVAGIIKLSYLFIFMGGLYFVFHILSLFHQAYLLPENFKNKRYIECKVKANNQLVKSFNIEYFNDKYIFISLVDKSGKESFEVFQFEDFLDHDACSREKRHDL